MIALSLFLSLSLSLSLYIYIYIYIEREREREIREYELINLMNIYLKFSVYIFIFSLNIYNWM